MPRGRTRGPSRGSRRWDVFAAPSAWPLRTGPGVDRWPGSWRHLDGRMDVDGASRKVRRDDVEADRARDDRCRRDEVARFEEPRAQQVAFADRAREGHRRGLERQVGAGGVEEGWVGVVLAGGGRGPGEMHPGPRGGGGGRGWGG